MNDVLTFGGLCVIAGLGFAVLIGSLAETLGYTATEPQHDNWVTPRDGFRQVGLLRLAAMLVEAVLLIAICVAGILMLSIQDVHP